MEISVPKDHVKSFLDFLTLSGDVRKKFLQELKQSSPTFMPEGLASQIAEKLNAKESDVISWLAILISLYRTRLVKNTPVEDFIDVVKKTGESLLEDDSKERTVDWDSITQDLSEALKMDDPLGVTSKAIEVALEFGRIYYDARVLTDIRAVFNPDPNNHPSAAIIVHNLRISYLEDDNRKTMRFTLDSQDIKELQSELERAIQKQSTLQKVLDEADLRWLDQKVGNDSN